MAMLAWGIVWTALTLGSASTAPMLTLSGLSSGAYMAVQHHVAHSSVVSGVAALAGGPYWCANANAITAQVNCMTSPWLISMYELYAATEYAFGLLSIDSPSNIAKARVWLQSGLKDTVVHPGVMDKLEEYYQHYGVTPRKIFNLSNEHAFPTNFYGSNCSYLGNPFINNCGYDAAGELLNYFYGGKLVPPRQHNSSAFELDTLATARFTPTLVSPSMISLNELAYFYVPPACKKERAPREGPDCTFHIAYHGCEQTMAQIGLKFVRETNYLPWAEANNIVVLFPQAIISDTLPFNPKGCWDWWGYSGPDYATKLAPQLWTVTNMLQELVTRYGN